MQDPILTPVTAFTNSIYITQLDFDLDSVRDKILDLEAHLPGVHKSNRGGWQSESFGADTVPDFMQPVVDKISRLLWPVYTQMTLAEHPLMSNFWFNVNRQGNTNSVHNHPRCYFSAVWYVNVPNNSGDLVFYRPDMMLDYLPVRDATSPNNFGKYEVYPKNNQLVIFPSYLYHSVTDNCNTQEPRISVAFNFK